MRKPVGHIRRHGTGYQVIVPAGRDPITKRYEYVYRQASTIRAEILSSERGVIMHPARHRSPMLARARPGCTVRRNLRTFLSAKRRADLGIYLLMLGRRTGPGVA